MKKRVNKLVREATRKEWDNLKNEINRDYKTNNRLF